MGRPFCLVVTTVYLRAKFLNLSKNPLNVQAAQRQQFLSGALLDKAVRQADIQHRHQDLLRLQEVVDGAAGTTSEYVFFDSDQHVVAFG